MYLSLGSLGSADVELMQRLIDLLAAAGQRAVVSKGRSTSRSSCASGCGAPSSFRSRPCSRTPTW